VLVTFAGFQRWNQRDLSICAAYWHWFQNAQDKILDHPDGRIASHERFPFIGGYLTIWTVGATIW